MNTELVLLGVVVVCVLTILYLCFQFESFRAGAREDASRRAVEQLESWRSSDLDGLRAQQLEFARNEALLQLEQWKVQVHQSYLQQMETFRTTELETARVQQFEVAKNQMLLEIEQWKTQYEQGIRQDAIRKSAGVTLGKVTEHFIPYLPEFIYNPKDARFVGSPIDFVVFDGLSDGEVRSVIFVEVKTGKGVLSTRERRIRDAVEAKQVEWVELRPQFDVAIETTAEVTLLPELLPPAGASRTLG